MKVGDRDGNFSTSKVTVAYGKDKSFEINSLTPGITSANTMLSISSSVIDKADIFIVNLQGVVVKRLAINLVKGLTELRLNFNGLAKGSYVISIYNSNKENRTVQMLKM